MTMQSSNLVPVLQELPGGESGQRRSFREIITDLVNTDRATYAAEFASAVSMGMWPVFGDAILSTDFPGTEINESYLQAAYERTHLFDPDVDVAERWRQALADGEDDKEDLLDDLKGIVAEFNARDQLNQRGYNLELAEDRFQRGWDLHGTAPNGEYVQIQVRAGDSEAQIDRTIRDMQETDYPFAVGSDIHDGISDEAPELVDRIVATMGSDFDLVQSMEDGLETLSEAFGIAEAIPGAGAIIAASRLVYSVVKTEKEFKAADRTTKNKIQVVQTLTLMSRMGVTTVLATAGGMGGAAAGSFLPGIGNLIVGIVGSVGGVGMGMYLNRRLQPHMLNLALDITGLTNDDLFYYKNKPRIDTVAVNFQRTARELAASPA